jgi:hypothetical protein
MDAQDFRSLQEAYLEVYQEQELDEGVEGRRFEYNQRHGRPLITPEVSQSRSSKETLGGGTYERGPKRLPKSKRKYDRQVLSGVRAASEQEKNRARKRMGIKEDIYDIILSHLLDEGYAETPEAAEKIMVHMSEEWRESIVEAEGSYGQTPTARKAYGDLANKRRETPASEFSKRGEKTQKVKSAQKHFDRTGNPDAGNRGKKSTKPSWHSYQRQGMTQKDRTNLRGQSEYGHIGHDPDYHGSSGPGSKPKGKKLERQRKTGVSAD